MNLSPVQKAMQEITQHIENYNQNLDLNKVHQILKILQTQNKIFVYGAGRSGLVGKAFAMRLMHLSLNVFVIGETVYPAIKENDVLFVISGSGETSAIVNACKSAKEKKAKIIALTSNLNSSIGKIGDIALEVKGRTKEDVREKDYEQKQIIGQHQPLSPLGTLFEDTCQVLLDGLIVGLMKEMGKNEQQLKERHANIE
ncbi:MAG: 6-phospho-3-hexuloisomerase [Candidatus Diapherotrites archaeon]|nr:6-phospho-3-hexuloisomerase [Candidatus Diapherotrites archaeon]